MMNSTKMKIRPIRIKTINTLADALAMLDRYVFRCRWHWLCVLPGRLWSPTLEDCPPDRVGWNSARSGGERNNAQRNYNTNFE